MHIPDVIFRNWRLWAFLISVGERFEPVSKYRGENTDCTLNTTVLITKEGQRLGIWTSGVWIK